VIIGFAMKTKIQTLVVSLVTLLIGAAGGAWWAADRAAGASGGAPLISFGGGDASGRSALADMEARLRELEAKLAAREAELAGQQARLAELADEKARLQERAQSMSAEIDKLNDEWAFSYGSTREAGKFVGSMISDALAMRGMDPNDPDAPVKMRDMFLKFASLGPILQEMQKIDDKPREFAEFRAAVLGEALALDDASRGRIASIVEGYKTRANSLPEDDENRRALNEQAAAEIRATLAPDKQELLDAIPGTRMGRMSDLLETPSLDPARWQQRMRQERGRE
jgi:uncharacterized coiled-coil protein SlyX